MKRGELDKLQYVALRLFHYNGMGYSECLAVLGVPGMGHSEMRVQHPELLVRYSKLLVQYSELLVQHPKLRVQHPEPRSPIDFRG